MHYIFCYAYPVQWKLCLFTLYTSTKNMRRVNAPPRVNSAGENSTLHQTSSLSQYSPPPPLITQQSRFIPCLLVLIVYEQCFCSRQWSEQTTRRPKTDLKTTRNTQHIQRPKQRDDNQQCSPIVGRRSDRQKLARASRATHSSQKPKCRQSA